MAPISPLNLAGIVRQPPRKPGIARDGRASDGFVVVVVEVLGVARHARIRNFATFGGEIRQFRSVVTLVQFSITKNCLLMAASGREKYSHLFSFCFHIIIVQYVGFL